jgi:hypothetical protein
LHKGAHEKITFHSRFPRLRGGVKQAGTAIEENS